MAADVLEGMGVQREDRSKSYVLFWAEYKEVTGY